MKLQLLHGDFEARDALDILTRMIHIKIRYHEDKIHSLHNEEDIKMRESRIKQLQKDLYEIRRYIENTGGKISMEGTISIS